VVVSAFRIYVLRSPVELLEWLVLIRPFFKNMVQQLRISMILPVVHMLTRRETGLWAGCEFGMRLMHSKPLFSRSAAYQWPFIRAP
jgi:hypothetical protein